MPGGAGRGPAGSSGASSDKEWRIQWNELIVAMLNQKKNTDWS
jgi:hypothetical protein